MINVRVQIFRDCGDCDKREYYSSAIRDPAALLALGVQLHRSGVRYTVWDDFGHANIADGCLAVAERLGGERGPIEYTWGPNRRYCCRFAPVPRAHGKLNWEGIGGETDRELSGPLPEEVAAHTPCACCEADYQIQLTPFDVHGSPVRPAQPAASTKVVTVRPLLRPTTWLERIVQLILGCSPGEAVRDP